MACLLAFMHGLQKQSAADVRCWSWTGKGREGRGMATCVWICRLGELWVVAEALALEWKGGRRQGYSCACPNLVDEVLARTVGTRTEQRMVHINDGYLGLCLCPPNCVSCLAVMKPGTGGGGGGVMVNREVQWPLFHLMGRVGVGEAMNLREERGVSAGMLAMWRQGGVQYMAVQWHEIMLWGPRWSKWLWGWGELRRAVCGEVNQRQQSVICTDHHLNCLLQWIHHIEQ